MSSLKLNGSRLVCKIVEGGGAFADHVNAGADKRANRYKADRERDRACNAGGSQEFKMDEHPPEHGNQCFGGETSHGGIAETNGLAEIFRALSQLTGLLLQSLVEIRVFAYAGHYAGNLACTIHDASNAIAKTEYKHGGGVSEQGWRDNGGENRKRAISGGGHS